MEKITIKKCDDYNEQAYIFYKTLSEHNEDVEINLENKVYVIGGKYAYTDYLYISNNDHGLKKIAFPLINKKNITINGNGATLKFVGRILPFWIDQSENITIKNLTIEYERTFFTQGKIEEVKNDLIGIKIDKNDYPYEISKDKALFIGRDYSSSYIHGLLEYDINKRGPKYGADDIFFKDGEEYKCYEENGCLYIKSLYDYLPTVGNMIVIKHEERFVPGIALNSSSNILIQDVNIRQAGTMGIVAQYCKNIEIKGIQVATDRTKDHLMSTNADATHFVGCSGHIEVTDCLFESQLDDAINVHGNFFEVDKIVNPSRIIAVINHFQQVGVFGFEKGHRLSIINKMTMLEEFEVIITNILPLNDKYVEIEFDKELAFDPDKYYCIDDKDTYPTLYFAGNTVRANRARGLLLTSSKEMIIENNTINAEGAAIKISADTDYWYESGPVSKLIIRNNTMSSENIFWGNAIIDIDPEMKELVEKEYFHNEIFINNNKIIMGSKPLIYGKSIKLLDISDNTYINSEKEIKIDIENVGSLKK